MIWAVSVHFYVSQSLDINLIETALLGHGRQRCTLSAFCPPEEDPQAETGAIVWYVLMGKPK